jgi:polysaccharide chain length determinant protein (PEP-CTERM system associated)
MLQNLRKGDPLKKYLADLQKNLDQLRVIYTDSYPEVMRVKAEIESVRERMKNRGKGEMPVANPDDIEKVEIELKAVLEGEQVQRNIITNSKALLREIPATRSAMEELEREKNNRKLIYDQLVARHGQSEVSKQVEVQDKATTFRIVDPAVLPLKPKSPNRVQIILIGILTGVVGGFGLVLLMDRLDQSVKSAETLKVFGFPIMAVIPKILDPEEQLREKNRDKRLYRLACVYFGLILMILTLEGLKMTSMGDVFEEYGLDGNLADVTKKVAGEGKERP